MPPVKKVHLTVSEETNRTDSLVPGNHINTVIDGFEISVMRKKPATFKSHTPAVCSILADAQNNSADVLLTDIILIPKNIVLIHLLFQILCTVFFHCFRFPVVQMSRSCDVRPQQEAVLERFIMPQATGVCDVWSH